MLLNKIELTLGVINLYKILDFFFSPHAHDDVVIAAVRSTHKNKTVSYKQIDLL